MELYGRVAQLGEHLLCKHVFISPKPLNRHLLTVQNPPLVGLTIGLQILATDIKDTLSTCHSGVFCMILQNKHAPVAAEISDHQFKLH